MCGGMDRKEKMKRTIGNQASLKGHEVGKRFSWGKDGSASNVCIFCGAKFTIPYPETPDSFAMINIVIYDDKAKDDCQQNLYKTNPEKVREMVESHPLFIGWFTGYDNYKFPEGQSVRYNGIGTRKGNVVANVSIMNIEHFYYEFIHKAANKSA